MIDSLRGLQRTLGQIDDPSANVLCHGSIAEVTLMEDIFKTGFTETTKANPKDNFPQIAKENLTLSNAFGIKLFAKGITRKVSECNYLLNVVI